MKTDIDFLSYLAHLLLELEMFQTKIVEKLETHFVFSNFFFFENRAVFEIMWKNVVQQGRPQMTVWRMRFACWMTKAADTHKHTHTHTHTHTHAFPLEQRLHERVSMLRYTYIACLV